MKLNQLEYDYKKLTEAKLQTHHCSLFEPITLPNVNKVTKTRINNLVKITLFDGGGD